MRERSDGGPRDEAPVPLPDPLPHPVIDAHCHLDLMGGDVGGILAAAQSVGVGALVTIGIDLPSSRWAADTAAAHEHIHAAVAVHPNEAAQSTDEVLAGIELLASRPEVRAVGETGLDHFRTGVDGHARQEESFRAHIEIAKRTGRALVIHDRDAHDDVLRVLADVGAPERTVFHCFSGDAAMAQACARAGYVLSFAGNVTFKNAGPLREALAATPLDRLLVETDAPFLTPVPYRGRPNAPALIPYTLAVMAEVKGVTLRALCEALAGTTAWVFGTLDRR